MVIFPLGSNARLYEVDPRFFKTVKVKKFSFLFVTTYDKKSTLGGAKGSGLILPMFILQLFGYIIALLSIVTVLLLIFLFDISLRTTVTIVLAICGSWMLFITIFVIGLMLVSKKRENA